MSRFDGLRTKETVESSKFAGLRTMPLNNYSSANLSTKETSLPKGDSWSALIGKSALKGVTSIPQLLLDLGKGAAEADRRKLQLMGYPNTDIETPEININKKLENITGLDLEPHPVGEAQRIASHAAEFAGGLGPFGLASKGNLILKGLGFAKQAGVGGSKG